MATYNFNDVKTGNTASWETLISYLNATLGTYDLVTLPTTLGWQAFGATLTYASATTFTISGDWTGILGKGDKLCLTQTTSKYFVITGVSYSAPNTTVTITGGSSYSLANAAITNPLYSHQASPFGYPAYFNATVTHGGFSANPTYNAHFTTIGRWCHFIYTPTGSGTSNAASYTVSAPITADSSVAEFDGIGGFCQDNGARGVDPLVFISGGSSTVTIQLTGGYSNFQSSGNKRCSFFLWYAF